MKRTDRHWLSHFVYSPIAVGIVVLLLGVPMFASLGEKTGAWGMVGFAVFSFLIAFLNYRSYQKEKEKEVREQLEKEEKERQVRRQQEQRQQELIRAQQKRIEDLQNRLREQEENNAKDVGE